MIRLGLCCLFAEEPIRFRITTVAALRRLSPAARARKLADLCLGNATALEAALRYCAANGIGAFRVNSQILPVKTHPETRYEVADLPGGQAVVRQFKACGRLAREAGIRTLFHPDQFILLSSPDEGITRRSIEDLEYQAQVAGWIGADVINIHAGGAYGQAEAALERVADAVRQLSPAVGKRLTFENDDRVYSVADLLPLCRKTGIPLTYDVHHHRCLPDGLTVEDATRRAMETWDREPVFHVSSPRDGWRGRGPARHHDYIHPRDFPACWLPLDVTVEVEAKAKEKAVRRLQRDLKAGRVSGQ